MSKETTWREYALQENENENEKGSPVNPPTVTSTIANMPPSSEFATPTVTDTTTSTTVTPTPTTPTLSTAPKKKNAYSIVVEDLWMSFHDQKPAPVKQ